MIIGNRFGNFTGRNGNRHRWNHFHWFDERNMAALFRGAATNYR
jgi:hypothetical protein